MTQHVRPCAHCGFTTFHFVPNMQLDVTHATTLLGMAASQTIKGRRWTFTLVICAQCGSTQTFTANGTDLVHWVPGAGTAATPPR